VLPDVREVLHTWEEASTQIADRSTAMARELLGAGLHWMAQGAAGAGEWVQAFGAGAQRWSEMARAAEHRAQQVEDLPGLWTLELGLLGDTTQSSAQLGQQAWATQLSALASLSQEAAARAGELMQHWLDSSAQSLFGAPDTAPPASRPARPAVSNVPIVPFLPTTQTPLPQVMQTMAETAQAFWSAVAAQTVAAMQAPQDSAATDEAPSRPATQPGRKRADTKHRRAVR
jgi:hypothetical protein